LASSDLNNYYKEKGFEVKTFSNPLFDKKEIEDIIRKNNFDIIYTTSNIHYRGISKGSGNSLHLLDSFYSSPQIITPEEAISNAYRSLGQFGGRYNVVGIIKKPNKKFEIASRK
jgi:hypothetical protein